jgi:hypothetical protein
MDNPQHYQPLSHALHPPVVPTYEEEEEEEENEDEGVVEEQLDPEDDDHEVAAGCVITMKSYNDTRLIASIRKYSYRMCSSCLDLHNINQVQLQLESAQVQLNPTHHKTQNGRGVLVVPVDPKTDGHGHQLLI